MRSSFYFFTDINDFQQSSEKAFGPLLSNETHDRFRLCSLHNSNNDVPAYAVVSGLVLAQKIPDTDLINLIIRPMEHSDTFNFKIKYIIYRGVKESSLFDGSYIADARTNDLTKSIWKSFNALKKADKTITDTSPSKKSLGINFMAGLPSDNPDLINDDDYISTIFNRVNDNFQLPFVRRGWEIGLFNNLEYGIEIILEDIIYEPIFKIARQVDHILEVEKITGSSTAADNFVHWNMKEEILHYVDPISYFASFHMSLSLKAYDENNSKVVRNDDLYTKIISKFSNKSRIYLDIRNERNNTLNYYKNYGNNIKLTYIENTSLTKNYYQINWPICILSGNDFPSSASNWNRLKISLPKGDNSKPLVFLSQAYTVESFPKYCFGEQQFIEQIEETAGFISDFDILIPRSGSARGASTLLPVYINIRYLKKLPENPISSSDTTIRALTSLDNVFMPFSMRNPFENGDIGSNVNSGIIDVIVYDTQNYVDVTNQRGYDFIAKTGYAVSAENITFFVFPLVQRSAISNNEKNISITLSSERVNSADYFLKFLAYRDRKFLLTKQVVKKAAENLQIEVLDFYNVNAKSFVDPDLKDFYAISMTREQFLNLYEHRNDFEPNTPVFLGVEEKEEDEIIGDDGTEVLRYKLVLRGFVRQGNNIVISNIDDLLDVQTTDNLYTAVDMVLPQLPGAGNVTLTAAVGIEAVNNSADVILVQQRLVELGYLLENHNETPQSVGTINYRNLVSTITAIADFTQIAIGIRLLAIRPNSIELNFLNQVGILPVTNITLQNNIGDGATNTPADVTAVINRLRDLEFITQDQIDADTRNNNHVNFFNAIKNFNFIMVGGSFDKIRSVEDNTIPAQDQVASLELNVLNRPYRFKRRWFIIQRSVGTGGINIGNDVRAIQDRLRELNYLTQVHFDAEAVALNNQVIPVANLTRTIAAINAFKSIRGLNEDGIIRPHDQIHKMLQVPQNPKKEIINHLGGVVGFSTAANANNITDVRNYQFRLHLLGFLKTPNLLAEIPNPGPGNINRTVIPLTIRAIQSYQLAANPSADRTISEGGRSNYLIEDPTYGSNTFINPNTRNVLANVTHITFGDDAAIARIRNAIAMHEIGTNANRGDGEVPALFTHGARMPTSFGEVQTIGSTAFDTVRNGTAPSRSMATYYSLDANAITSLRSSSDTMALFYDYILNIASDSSTNANYNQDDGNAFGLRLTTALNTTQPEELLAQAISAFKAAPSFSNIPGTTNLQRFLNVVNLDESVIDAMFRSAKMIRIIYSLNLGSTDAAKDEREDTFFDQTAGSNAQLGQWTFNTDQMGILRIDVRSYVRNRSPFEELRQGFITKAIFANPNGQKIRNLMTDNRGNYVARLVVTSNYNKVQNRINVILTTSPNSVFTARDIAAVTALAHNAGAANVNYGLNNLTGTTSIYLNDYVSDVIRLWDSLG